MGSPLAFKLIRTIDEFHNLSEEWNSLLSVSASHVPFLRHEYQTAWWRTLGGGEWAEGDLYIVTTRRMDGALSGIAPLFYTRNREGENAMMLIGSIEISDYLDVIARSEDLHIFLEALLDYLSTPQFPSWDVLDWYNILEDSQTLPALASAARRCGFSYTQERLQHCPFIPLPGDWEAYLAGIDKKQRHEIRRKMRRAESSDVPVRWYIVQDEASLDAQVEDFFRLMAQDEAKRAFLTETMRTQMHASAKAAFQAGWLQLAFLEVGGEKAAGYFNFDYDNRIWVYNSGIDARFGALSPGWVLLGRLLEWANDHQRTSFDFLRGSEDYKYRFGGIDRYIVRAQVRR
jgi:CelD/BcsL family acetyltransferase involved in cellulose biosynthesis